MSGKNKHFGQNLFFFPWVLMKHFQTAGAESDISRFSNKDKKILIYHYIAGLSLSSLMLASSSYFLLLLPSHALQKSKLSAFALLSFSYFCASVSPLSRSFSTALPVSSPLLKCKASRSEKK